MRIAFAVMAVPCLAAAASAADLKVPSDAHPTIQDAADAAQPGDRILVAKGVYEEHVTLTQSNVQILGKKAVWDGGASGICLLAEGDGVLVQGFAFRNGGTHVYVFGSGAALRKCSFSGSTSVSVILDGAGGSVTGCRFRGNSGGVVISGAGGAVTKCRLQQSDAGAIGVSGDGFLVEGNVVQNTDGDAVIATGQACIVSKTSVIGSTGDAIRVNGAGASVLGCTVSNTDSEGIEATGTGLLVEGNRVTFCVGLSILVDGDDAVVSGNRVSLGAENMITVNGDAFTVARNVVAGACNNSYGIHLIGASPSGGGTCDDNAVSDTAYWGIYVNADSVLVRRNRLLRCGSGNEGAVLAVGDGNTLEDCQTVEASGDGFRIDGTGAVLRRCVSKGATRDGFQLNGPVHRIEGCSATDSGAEGLDNRGTGTDAVGNRLLGNRIDLANAVGGGATFDEFTGNVFVSGSTTTEPEID